MKQQYTEKELESRNYKGKWCANCKFFSYLRDNEGGMGCFGHCLRFPPTIPSKNANDEMMWPVVYSNYNLCGEYKRGRCILK